LQILPQALEERVPYLALCGLRAILDLGEQLGLNPDAFIPTPIRSDTWLYFGRPRDCKNTSEA
jgi:hypothetical protein